MIIDKLRNVQSGFYPDLLSGESGLSKRLATGFNYLLTTDLAQLEVGKIEIDGDQVFALVQEYESKPMEQGRWESHVNYIDIQCVVEGEESIGYANVDDVELGEYNEAKDRYVPQGEGSFVTVGAGMFGLFMPEDAHMPNMAVDEPAPVKKVVIKVAA